VARTLDVVGEKWSLVVIRELMLGSTRFEEIAHYTGAPRDVLTTRLRSLERAGILGRVAYQDRPQRFEYRLTELGESLHPVISVLRAWGDRHLARAEGPPVQFRHECGAVFHARVDCASCGKQVGYGDLSRLDP
jgi:DNA-binding HxlR family transcriptional regulator